MLASILTALGLILIAAGALMFAYWSGYKRCAIDRINQLRKMEASEYARHLASVRIRAFDVREIGKN